jgi:hypothetical protein
LPLNDFEMAPIETVLMTPSRPIALTRPARETVEALTVLISALCAERQDLRAKGASATALERNRVKIARAQWELSHALIERYLPKSAERAA